MYICTYVYIHRLLSLSESSYTSSDTSLYSYIRFLQTHIQMQCINANICEILNTIIQVHIFGNKPAGMYVCMDVYIYMVTCMYVYVFLYAYIYIYIYIYICIHICLCIYICLSLYVYLNIYIFVYISAYLYMHLYITHLRMHRCVSA